MPKARLSINRGLPARWSIRRGAFYYAVPPGQEDVWDGKKLFRLGTTQAEAYAAFAKRLGESAIPKGWTYGDVISRYLRDETPKKAPESQKNDEYAASFLRPVFARFPLAVELQPSWAYQYVDQRRSPKTGKPSPAQARKEISIFSSMITAAVRWGWLPRNPLLGQLRFESTAKPGRYVTDDAFLAAVEHAPEWLQVYLWAKLATGLRRSDMWALTWSAVTPTATGAEITVTPRKTARSRPRTLIFELDRFTAAELDRLMPLDPDPARHVFLTSRGRPFAKPAFESAWNTLMAKVTAAGFERFTDHDVRGKVGSDAVTLASAQRRLGHASPAVTMRHYRRAAERIRAGE